MVRWCSLRRIVLWNVCVVLLVVVVVLIYVFSMLGIFLWWI